ncbi:MAG: SDR family oxidoreductase [Patescibacteria group bacterium]
MKGKIVVVTGGAGFIGSHLVDALLERGNTVRVIDNLSTGRKENIAHVLERVEFVEDSVLNDNALKHVLKGADCVFHQAAVPSVPKSVKDPLTSHEANSTGTLKVLLAAQDLGVRRVIYATSSSVYGDTKIFPTPETVPPNPLSPYALQKFTGEKYATLFYKLYGLETVVLRYFNVFGPRQDPHSEYSAVIPRFIRLLKEGYAPTVFGDGSTSRDFTFISDVVDANILASEVEAAAGEVFNCAGGKPTTLNQLIEVLQKLLGTNMTPIYQDFRVGDIKNSYADMSKAERILGFKAKVSFEEGLTRTIPTIL